MLRHYKLNTVTFRQKSAPFSNLLNSIIISENKTFVIHTTNELRPIMKLTEEKILNNNANATDNYISLFDLISEHNLTQSENIVYVRTLLDDNYYQNITYRPSDVLHKLKFFNYKDDNRITDYYL